MKVAYYHILTVSLLTASPNHVHSFQSFATVGFSLDPHPTAIIATTQRPIVEDKIDKFKSIHCNERIYKRVFGNGDGDWSNDESMQVSKFLTNKARKHLQDSNIPTEVWDELLAENKRLVQGYCAKRSSSRTSSTEPRLHRFSLLRRRRDSNQKEEIEDRIRTWRQEWCDVSHYRKKYSLDYSRDGGEWGPTETRSFYLNKLEHGLRDLVNLGLPIEYWGDLAFELRETLKIFAREQSYFLWRIWAMAMAGDELTLEERKERIRKRLIDHNDRQHDTTTPMHESQIRIQISLSLFDSASRTRQSVNHAIQMLSIIENATMKPRYASYMLSASQHIVSS